MLDIVPILRSVAEHEFRSRNKVKEIQLDMRYQSTSPSSKMQRSRSQMSNVKLPTINNPEIKMHFKGLEEMGNRLLSIN